MKIRVRMMSSLLNMMKTRERQRRRESASLNPLRLKAHLSPHPLSNHLLLILPLPPLLPLLSPLTHLPISLPILPVFPPSKSKENPLISYTQAVINLIHRRRMRVTLLVD
jgi:hypothetical protein